MSQVEQLTLLRNGELFFPALLRAIAAAQHSIHIETYIFEPDEIGHQLATTLRHAVQRGIRVQLVVDGFGSRDFARYMADGLRQAGLEILIFRRELGARFTLFPLRRYRLRRLHRKLVSIDHGHPNACAFIGGINILDDHHNAHGGPTLPAPRLDYALRLTGPLVTHIAWSQQQLWRQLSWIQQRRRPRPLTPPTLAPSPQGSQFIQRDNVRHRRAIENAYLQAIEQAQQHILIANAYFLPGRRFRHALIAAAQRGVRVTLLLQGRIEYRLLHYATAALYPHLLQAGIHIVEYRKSLLHAKVAVIDDNWATIGSSNIDPFSLVLAREANLIIHQTDFCQRLYQQLQQDMRQGAHPLTPSDWQRQRWPQRLINWTAFGLIRWLAARLTKFAL